MFFHVISILVMKVTVVEIVDMISMPNAGVAAIGSVHVIVVRVVVVIAGHEFSPWSSKSVAVSSAAWSRISRKRCAT